jgi:BirA family transcriptional regulator, biotin operon repressor / biotin---[acetyl-CoA-carboxylase] ligase
LSALPALDVKALRARTQHLSLGQDVHYFARVSSTNEVARLLGPGAWQPGTTIISDFQLHGKGRRGRTWGAAPNSSILLSIILQPPADSSPTAPVMLAALAVANAIESECELTTELKWPNDVLVNGRKVCGILTENAPQSGQPRTIVGIGINVNNSPDFEVQHFGDATCLERELGQAVDRVQLAAALLEQINTWYGCLTERPNELFLSWRSRLRVIGRSLTVVDAVGSWTGQGIGVARDGALLVRDELGITRTIYAADVSVRTCAESENKFGYV